MKDTEEADDIKEDDNFEEDQEGAGVQQQQQKHTVGGNIVDLLSAGQDLLSAASALMFTVGEAESRLIAAIERGTAVPQAVLILPDWIAAEDLRDGLARRSKLVRQQEN